MIWKHGEVKAIIVQSKTVFKALGIELKVFLREDVSQEGSARRICQKRKAIIVISRRYGTAPARNRARRRIREALYKNKILMTTYHVVIFVRKDINSIPFLLLCKLIRDSQTELMLQKESGV